MTISTIIIVIIFAVNCFALCLALMFLAKWLGRIERKIDDLESLRRECMEHYEADVVYFQYEEPE